MTEEQQGLVQVAAAAHMGTYRLQAGSRAWDTRPENPSGRDPGELLLSRMQSC